MELKLKEIGFDEETVPAKLLLSEEWDWDYKMEENSYIFEVLEPKYPNYRAVIFKKHLKEKDNRPDFYLVCFLDKIKGCFFPGDQQAYFFSESVFLDLDEAKQFCMNILKNTDFLFKEIYLKNLN